MSDVWKAVPRGLLVAVVIAFAFLVGLGVWQLQRLHWKEGLIHQMSATESQAPQPAAQVLATAGHDWRAVTLPECPLEPEHVLYLHSEVDGHPGFRVITACPIGDGQNILVDLGFVSGTVDLDASFLTPTGRLRPFEPRGAAPANDSKKNDWYWRSAAEMGQALGVTVRGDDFVVADLKTTLIRDSGGTDITLTGLMQGPLTAPLPNRHLEYALTWFGLAAALLVMFAALVFQRLKAQKRA